MSIDPAELLRQAETYLAVTHGQAARHDVLGADFACSGCELRSRISGALAQLAVPSAPAATDLRERVAAAIRAESSRVDDIALADAVLAVLAPSAPFDVEAGMRRLADDLHRAEGAPAGTDRGAVLTETERTMLAYALDQAQEHIYSRDGFTDEDQAAVTSLRRLADEAQQAESAVDHRLDLSEALGLGTGAPWDAIRDRAAELYAAEQAPREHCTHHVSVHNEFHRTPVDGCPWCTPTAPVKAKPRRQTQDVPLPGDEAQQAGEGR